MVMYDRIDSFVCGVSAALGARFAFLQGGGLASAEAGGEWGCEIDRLA